MTIKLNIKPLSVNEVWKGKRYKTKLYKKYERDVMLLLPNLQIAKDTSLILTVNVGFSNKCCDLSNIIKPFEDILCKKYKIDDRFNYELHMYKHLVKKGEEYISFNIEEADRERKEDRER